MFAPPVLRTTSARALRGRASDIECLRRVNSTVTYVESAATSERTAELPPLRSATPGPWWQLLTGALAVAMPIITAVDHLFAARPVLALLYLLLIPGVPLAALMRLPSRLASATIAIAISLSVQVLLAQGSLTAGALDATGDEIVASAISVGALLFAVGRRHLLADLDPVRSGHLAAERVRDWFAHGWAAGAGLLIALVLWVIGVRSIDPTDMDQYGIISVVLRSTVPLALAVVAALAVVELRRPQLRTGTLAAIVIVFLVVLQGTPSAIESAASLPSAWVHVGFSQYIRDHGAALKGFDARFSWPGFFAMLANLSTSAGLPDAGEFLRWAPLVQDLLMLLPVTLLARRLCPQPWMVWVSALLYSAGNWFQQDYLSPQGLALYLGVSVIALVLWSADGRQDSGGSERPARAAGLRGALRRPQPGTVPLAGMTRSAYLSLGAALIVLLLAVVVSHQLTPVALVLTLAWISFVRWTRFPGLWIVTAVMTVTWVFWGATDFWSGHLDQIFGGIGSLGSSLDTGVGARIVGNPAHTDMLYLRFAFSGACIVLALVGIILIRRSSSALLLLGLCFSPFLIIALQSYGGEVVIRAFLYALPGLAIASAQALGLLVRRGRQWAATGFALVLLLGLLQLATRGANAPFERVTSTQLQATAAFNQIAAPGSTVGSFSAFNSLGRLEPARYYGTLVTPTCTGSGTATRCSINKKPDYLFFTSSQDSYGVLGESRTAGWSTIVVDQLVAQNQYTISFQVADAVILKRVGPKT